MIDRLNIEEAGICFVSFSENSDHQETMYGMFKQLYGRYAVGTVGSNCVKVNEPPYEQVNRYVECPSRPGFSKGSFDVRKILGAVRAIRSLGFKTVYFESVHLWNAFVMLLLGSRFVFVQSLHDVTPHNGSKSVLLCQKLLCKLSDYTVIKSGSFSEQAKALYRIPDERLIVFDVWRSYPEYENIRDAGAVEAEFLFFGRLRKYKGLVNLERIIRACPDLGFRIMGAPDDESTPLVDRLAALPNVLVTAREVSDEEMREAFRNSKWVLLPYESASQSGVIIDAYKHGRPVIAYDVGAVSSQVDNGVTGFLVKPGDAEGFAGVVRKVSSMPDEEYRSYSINAYRYGFEKYSTQRRCGDFAKAFRVKGLST